MTREASTSTTSSGPCAGYGALCDNEACCAGLTCDSYEIGCYLPRGAQCTPPQDTCAHGLVCLDGVCAPSSGCAGYESSCADTPCCEGTSCDQHTHVCEVSLGFNCAGFDTQCANGLVCTLGQCAEPTTCSSYGASCEVASCCADLACDPTTDLCFVADGGGCSGTSNVCAGGEMCISGSCAPASPSCLGYGVACTAAGGCCTGLACDPTAHMCYVGTSYDCGGPHWDAGFDYACANQEQCTIGICAPSTQCGEYGLACGVPGCCDGLVCDTASNTCLSAPGYPCLSSGGVGCANGVTCNENECEDAALSCRPYLAECGYGTSCCPGLECDVDNTNTCLAATGADCFFGAITCVSPSSCGDPSTCQ